MQERIKKFKQLINSSSNIVVLGGAGVSTESGIPDFRSENGLFNQEYKYPVELMLSHTFFLKIWRSFMNFIKKDEFIKI